MFSEALSFVLFQRALAAAALASLCCGIVGTYVVSKRMASASGGLSHVAFGGLGLGFLLNFNPLLGAFGFCIVFAILMALVYRRFQQSLDTLIAIGWALGMALGMIFIALKAQAAPDLASYLFGSILFVPSDFVLLVLLVDLLILFTVLFFYKEFQAIAFDEEFAEVAGLPIAFFIALLLVLVAIVVVTLIQIVGVILTIALLTTPAAIAKQWCNSLKLMMLMSSFWSLVSMLSGLFSAYYLSAKLDFDIPTGPLIIVILTAIFALSCLIQFFLKTRKATFLCS